MKNLLFFTTSHYKINEIKNLFNTTNIKILSLSDLPKIKIPKETGRSFADNAKIKSLYGFKQLNIPCFADDSGICISALNNRPGVHSKRFLEKFQNKKELFKYIINKVYTSKNTYAYFTTNICFTIKLRHYVIFEGKVSGNISLTPRGMNGFGYDPLFIPVGHTKTFAEMGTKEKNRISHRSLAIKKFINFLAN